MVYLPTFSMILMVNVGRCTIHGSYGVVFSFKPRALENSMDLSYLWCFLNPSLPIPINEQR